MSSAVVDASVIILLLGDEPDRKKDPELHLKATRTSPWLSSSTDCASPSTMARPRLQRSERPPSRAHARATSRAAAADESDYPEHLGYYKHEDTRAMLRRYSNAWWLLGFLALASNFETVAEGLRYEENE